MNIDSWINFLMDQKTMNLLVLKLINVYHIQSCHFDVLLDLYGELVLEIHKGKSLNRIIPNEYTFLKKLYWKFVNLLIKTKRIDDKIQKMFTEKQNVNMIVIDQLAELSTNQKKDLLEYSIRELGKEKYRLLYLHYILNKTDKEVAKSRNVSPHVIFQQRTKYLLEYREIILKNFYLGLGFNPDPMH